MSTDNKAGEARNPELRTVTVKGRGNYVDVENTLVLFPKYMAKLMDLGYDLKVTGDRIGDRRACKLIVDCALGNLKSDYCDVLVYFVDKKVWMAISLEEGAELSLRRKGYDQCKYYTELRDFKKYDDNASKLVNALMNYIRIYSSASIKIV